MIQPVQGDENKPKAWSKYAPDSSAYKKLHGVTNLKEINNQQLNKEKKLNPIVKELSEKVIYSILIFKKILMDILP